MTPRDRFFDVPAPLPGTETPKRALFVDRWGTLLEGPGDDVQGAFDKPRFLSGAVNALFRSTQAGYAIYLIGNEDSVAQGLCSDATWKRFESEMLSALRAQGVQVGRCYACLDHPVDGKGKHLRDSVFLLPNTGAMYHARQHDGIHLPSSWVIGDSTIELAAGWRAGCLTAGVLTGVALEDGVLETDLDMKSASLAVALEEILQASKVAR